MSGISRSLRGLIAASVGLAFVLTVVWSLGSTAKTMAFGVAARGDVALVDGHDRVSAPLKPDWVEALLDARATALRALLAARDLQSTKSKPR